MADRRREWIRAGLAIAVLAAIILLLAPPGGQVSLDQRLTTTRASPDGAAALYEMLGELDIPVERRMVPLDGATPLGRVLVILDPTEPMTRAEREAVLGWVEDGGALIGALRHTQLLDDLGVNTLYVGRDPGRTAAPASDRWTEGVDSVGAVAYAHTMRSDTRLADVEPLLEVRDTTGYVVLHAQYGKGTVVLISDPSLLSNERIGEGDAALIFARAAASLASDDGTVVFDEYHHGHRGGTPARAFLAFLRGTPAGWMLLQLLAVAGLAALPRALRFGSPVEDGPPPRRSPLEHVAALGEVYRQARAAELGRRRLLVGFARRLGRERPLPGGETTFLERIARGAPADAAAVEAVRRAWEGNAPVRDLAERIDEAINRLGRKT